MTGAIALTMTGCVLMVAMQELPIPQQWTIISVLGFVLAGVTWLLQGVGNRMVGALERLNNTNTDLVLKLEKLAQQHEAFQEFTSQKHEEYARERERAVEEVKRAIEDLRERGRR